MDLNRANKNGETPADEAFIQLWDEALELLLKASRGKTLSPSSTRLCPMPITPLSPSQTEAKTPKAR